MITVDALHENHFVPLETGELFPPSVLKFNDVPWYVDLLSSTELCIQGAFPFINPCPDLLIFLFLSLSLFPFSFIILVEMLELLGGFSNFHIFLSYFS